jgi:excisionase family DNA binding protein
MSTAPLTPKWLTVVQVAALLNQGVPKTRMLIAQRKIRSVKDGKYRRVLPEWVDEYIATVVSTQEAA